jgi:hypothetical protein
MMRKGIKVEHNQDGTHGAVTATSVSTDTITEDTANSGVTIDGLNIKDSKLATNNSVVTANITDAAVTPAKRTGGFAAGQFPTSGTGNHAITGLGFTPRLVRFFMLVGTATSSHRSGYGVMTSTYQAAACEQGNLSNVARKSTEVACILSTSVTGTTEQVGVYVSMDADGFTVNMTTNSTDSNWVYEAYS